MQLIGTRSTADLVTAEALWRLKARAASPQTAARYMADPAGFVKDCIEWSAEDAPAPYQLAALERLHACRRVALRGPHGLGKTSMASWALLWFAVTREFVGVDWKVVTTASAWRQLTRYLWPEIRKWAARLRWATLGREGFGGEFLQLELRLGHGAAFAVASDTPALIEGAHAESLLYILDEAKAIPAPIWDAVEGALAAGDCYALAVSTPAQPAGRFYDLFARRRDYSDWETHWVSLEDAVAAGRVNPEWAEQRRRQWGESSPVYQNRVLVEFASCAGEGIIPLAWVEQANERWEAWQDLPPELQGELRSVGVDVARTGEDQTVLALLRGDTIAELRAFGPQDTMATTGQVVAALAQSGAPAIVDVIGLGAGVVDRLREQGLNAVAFNAAEGTPRRDRSGELGFANLRAAAWWQLREMLDPAGAPTLALPPDDSLIGDLTAPHWRVTSGGLIQVESKDEIRRRLGRSTDAGDAVMMALMLPTTMDYDSAVVEPPPLRFSPSEF